jgi:hypothetical protein
VTVGSADRRAVLEAFAADLGRESHVLAERPELLWQQLHNRLQWRDEAVERLLAGSVPAEARVVGRRG